MGEVETKIVSKALLPDLAAAIAKEFPELKGRSLAVAECDISATRENLPTLPLCMIGLIREQGNGSVQTRTYNPDEQFLVQFWFKPERYKLANGADSPFWSFYDYDTLRDRFVTFLESYVSPRSRRVRYVTLEIDVDPYAIVISLTCAHQFEFCPLDEQYPECTPEEMKDGRPIDSLTFSIEPLAVPYCGPLVPEPEEVDPCK